MNHLNECPVEGDGCANHQKQTGIKAAFSTFIADAV
jgi:hypothetical protein